MATAKQVAAQRRAESRGFASVYQMRKFERENKAIGGAGAPTITRTLAQQKHRVLSRRAESQASALAKFGLTLTQFKERHEKNRGWEEAELARRAALGTAGDGLVKAFLRSQAYHRYDESIGDAVTWTEAKVGYVASFYAANVARRTSYWSLYKDPLNLRRKKRWGGHERDTVGAFNKMNAAQYFYLTQATDLMTVAEYEVSYGTQQTRAQASTSPAAAVA